MPEGDTIHRIAAQLGPRLVGQTIERVTTQGLVRDLAGQRVTSVAAHGKHLVIELANGTYLRAHLGMYGRQRTYDRRDGDAMIAKMSPGRLTLAITTADTVALWVGARTIEISDRRAPLHGRAIASLGQDVLGDAFDPELAATRAAAAGNRTIADVVLDQRIAAGIGNVYKSEVLFLEKVSPLANVAALDDATLERVLKRARDLMRRNLGKGARRTTFGTFVGQNYFVYERSGQHCLKCDTKIRMLRQGTLQRSTYFCPECQGVTQPEAR